MSKYIALFESRCAEAQISPYAALSEGGVHATLWKKWRDGLVSPTLRNFEAAERGLEILIERAKAIAAAEPSHGVDGDNTGIETEHSGEMAAAE